MSLDTDFLATAPKETYTEARFFLMPTYAKEFVCGFVIKGPRNACRLMRIVLLNADLEIKFPKALPTIGTVVKGPS